jgi:hypothetical protein
MKKNKAASASSMKKLSKLERALASSERHEVLLSFVINTP